MTWTRGWVLACVALIAAMLVALLFSRELSRLLSIDDARQRPAEEVPGAVAGWWRGAARSPSTSSLGSSHGGTFTDRIIATRLAYAAAPIVDRCLGRAAGPRTPQLVRMTLARAAPRAGARRWRVVDVAEAVGRSAPGSPRSRCLRLLLGLEPPVGAEADAGAVRADALVTLLLPAAGGERATDP